MARNLSYLAALSSSRESRLRCRHHIEREDVDIRELRMLLQRAGEESGEGMDYQTRAIDICSLDSTAMNRSQYNLAVTFLLDRDKHTAAVIYQTSARGIADMRLSS
jgi:hypothetical protein